MSEVKTFTAQGSMFEGLVRERLDDAELLEALKKVGYDHKDTKVSYPMGVWVACLDTIWKLRLPTLTREAAWTELGRSFIRGYFATVVGRLIAVTFPFLSARLFIERMPSYIRTGLKDTPVRVEWVGPTSAILYLDGPLNLAAHVMEGVLDVALRRVRVVPRFRVEQLDELRSKLFIEWTMPAA